MVYPNIFFKCWWCYALYLLLLNVIPPRQKIHMILTKCPVPSVPSTSSAPYASAQYLQCLVYQCSVAQDSAQYLQFLVPSVPSVSIPSSSSAQYLRCPVSTVPITQCLHEFPYVPCRWLIALQLWRSWWIVGIIIKLYLEAKKNKHFHK